MRNSVVRWCAGFSVSAAAVLGPIAPARAVQAIAPFGIPCDSVGVSGIAYVPGVNCRLMNVDDPELFVTFLDDVTHQYPNGTNNPVGFNVPDWAWPFFVQHPRP
jgi:hypothetical protein